MSRNISARLQTLCGCTQIRLVPAPAPETIEVPIRAKDNPDGEGPPLVTKFRRFWLTRLSPSDVAVEADYREVPDPL